MCLQCARMWVRARCQRAPPAGQRDVKKRGGQVDARGPMRRDREAPTVVIVHGAWADGTSWREVIALLHVEGLSVIAVQNPLSALGDDVDAVTRVLKRQPGPVVLVGHGYGGTVITQAGDHPSVATLVYIAGCAPDIGEATIDVEKSGPAPPVISRFEVDAGGFLYLPLTVVREFLAHDLPEAEA